MVPSKGEVHREKCVDERRVLTMPPILALLRRRGNGQLDLTEAERLELPSSANEALITEQYPLSFMNSSRTVQSVCKISRDSSRRLNSGLQISYWSLPSSPARHYSHVVQAPFRVAVIGSGPAGFYTAYKIMANIKNAAVDMYEHLPVPYGLVRYGVAPDHPEVKVRCPPGLYIFGTEIVLIRRVRNVKKSLLKLRHLRASTLLEMLESGGTCLCHI